MEHLKPVPPSLGSLTAEITRLFRQEFRRRARHLGLTQPQCQALVLLKREPGLTQSLLAERLEVHPVTVTQLIDRMVKAGWVCREDHDTDRRAFRLFLTEKSAPVLNEIQRLALELQDVAWADLGKADRDRFIKLLIRVKANLSRDVCAAAAEPSRESS